MGEVEYSGIVQVRARDGDVTNYFFHDYPSFIFAADFGNEPCGEERRSCLEDGLVPEKLLEQYVEISRWRKWGE
ncbi:MAG: hypothetical protein V1889_03830 [archaeon]